MELSKKSWDGWGNNDADDLLKLVAHKKADQIKMEEAAKTSNE